MKTGRLLQQQGQTLVVVAVFLMALFAMLVLAMDVGHLYGERRRMQNAADAGALAGARELCFGNPANAVARAEEYAIDRNGAQLANVTIDDWVVEVEAIKTVDTYFARLFGRPTVEVVAGAAAACGEAESGCGLWPVAFDYARWFELYDNGRGCNSDFYVWNGNNENRDLDCKIYKCDVDGDGRDDVVSRDSRAWLDFSDVADPVMYPDSCVAPGCGEKELECWIRRDSGGKVVLPACIAGDNGVKAGVKDGVDSRKGDAVSIALFDYSGCPAESCPGQSYHVIEFGCITVGGWIQSLQLPRLDGKQPPWKGKVIKAAVRCDGACDTNCGSAGSGPPPPWGVGAVSLIR